MRRILLALLDVFLVALATVLALLVRDSFEVSPAEIRVNELYFGVSLAVAFLIDLASGMNRGFWRFTTLSDFTRIVVASIAIVLISLVVVFSINRLETVPRPLPVLQLFFMFFTLTGARLAVRMQHTFSKRAELGAGAAVLGEVETVLLVGVNALSELYLRSVEELAGSRVSVAGLIGQLDRQTGRAIRQYPVLGTVEQIRNILQDLEVHGVDVSRIVVAEPVHNLSESSLRELTDIESSFDIRLDFLAEQLGFDRPKGEAPGPRQGGGVPPEMVGSALSANSFSPQNASRHFQVLLKRFIDIVVSFVMLVVLAPVIALVWGIVAMAIGSPVLFWQRRPGRGGRNFKLYKFRTMGPGHAADGRKLSDAERMSRVGKFLRDTRLDELPQLFNILVGEMSFVGPRPLLPVDQPEFFIPRLGVRPGLTGWAQVNGGRLVSSEDKGALDLFYVRNMSLLLDIIIICKTVPMVLFREKSNESAVLLAWEEVRQLKAEAKNLIQEQAEVSFELESELT